MKRKTITLVVYMLVCMSLVSVGFAAWIITGGSKTEVSGNISATSVTDNSVFIDKENAYWDGNNAKGSIIFGHPKAADKQENAWLQFTSDAAGEEKLYAVYTFRVYIKDTNGNLGDAIDTLATTTLSVLHGGATIAQAKTAEEDAIISDLIGKNYITGPKLSFAVGSEAGATVTAVSAANGGTQYSESAFKTALSDIETYQAWVSVKVEFGWGALFNSVNPYEFYNEYNNGQFTRPPLSAPTGNSGYDTWKNHANGNLSYLYSKLGTAYENGMWLSIKLLGQGEE